MSKRRFGSFDESREMDIQMTYDRAARFAVEDGADEDGDSFGNLVNHEIGASRETAELDSWDDMPSGYEPADEADAAEYSDYLESKDFGEAFGDDDED